MSKEKGWENDTSQKIVSEKIVGYLGKERIDKMEKKEFCIFSKYRWKSSALEVQKKRGCSLAILLTAQTGKT